MHTAMDILPSVFQLLRSRNVIGDQARSGEPTQSEVWRTFDQQVTALTSDLTGRGGEHASRLTAAINEQRTRLRNSLSGSGTVVDYVRAAAELNTLLTRAHELLRPQGVTEFVATGQSYNRAAYTITTASTTPPTINGIPWNQGTLGQSGSEYFQIFGSPPRRVIVQQVAAPGGGFRYHVYSTSQYTGPITIQLQEGSGRTITLPSTSRTLASPAQPIRVPTFAQVTGTESNRAEQFAIDVSTLTQRLERDPQGRTLAAQLTTQLTRFGQLLAQVGSNTELDQHLQLMQQTMVAAQTTLDRGPLGLTRHGAPTATFRNRQTTCPQFADASFTMELSESEFQALRFRVRGPASNPFVMTHSGFYLTDRTMYASSQSPLGVTILPVRGADGRTTYRIEFSTAASFRGTIEILSANSSGGHQLVATVSPSTPAEPTHTVQLPTSTQLRAEQTPIVASQPARPQYFNLLVVSALGTPREEGRGGSSNVVTNGGGNGSWNGSWAGSWSGSWSSGNGSGNGLPQIQTQLPQPLSSDQIQTHVTNLLTDPVQVRAILTTPGGALTGDPNTPRVYIVVPGFPAETPPEGAARYELADSEIVQMMATATLPHVPGQNLPPITNLEFTAMTTNLRQIALRSPGLQNDTALATVRLCQALRRPDAPYTVSHAARRDALNHLLFTLPNNSPLRALVNDELTELNRQPMPS